MSDTGSLRASCFSFRGSCWCQGEAGSDGRFNLSGMSDRGVSRDSGTTYQAIPLNAGGDLSRRSTQIDHTSVPLVPAPVQNRVPKIKKPAIYDGQSNWEDYLVQFELIAAINHWDDNQKALELATSLRGSAQSILTDSRPEMRVNYQQLTAALSSRFQPENQAEMYRAQMKSKLRGRAEPIPELGQDIKRLVRLAYPSAPLEVGEQLARDCFIDSLNDSEMEWAFSRPKQEILTMRSR